MYVDLDVTSEEFLSGLLFTNESTQSGEKVFGNCQVIIRNPFRYKVKYELVADQSSDPFHKDGELFRPQGYRDIELSSEANKSINITRLQANDTIKVFLVYTGKFYSGDLHLICVYSLTKGYKYDLT